MLTLVISLFLLLIFNLFLGNWAYLLINNLPQLSESALNLDMLEEINKERSAFRHHKNSKEYHSWRAHIPVLGYLEHKNIKIIRYEAMFAAINCVTFSLMYFFNSKMLMLNNPLAMLSSLAAWSIVLVLWNVAFIVDLRHYIIPDIVNLGLFTSSLLLLIISSIIGHSFLWGNLITGVAIFLFFLILGVITGGMGGGDMKFIISSGIIFGPLVIFLVLMSSLFGVLYRVVIVPMFKLNEGKETPDDIKGKKVFPFGPFLVISSYILLIFSSWFAILLTSYIQMVFLK